MESERRGLVYVKNNEHTINVGDVVSFLMEGHIVKVNDDINYSIVKHGKQDGSSDYKLCNYESKNCKYFQDVDLDTLIKIFEFQEVDFIGQQEEYFMGVRDGKGI
jgi:hypothetical protein